jgi:hypothetical protein
MGQDLVLFALSVYGLAWLWTESSLFGPLRRFFQARVPPLLAEGLGCLVCVGCWVAMIVFGLRAFLGVFSETFVHLPLSSLPVWIGVSVAANWTLGRHNGELREEDS